MIRCGGGSSGCKRLHNALLLQAHLRHGSARTSPPQVLDDLEQLQYIQGVNDRHMKYLAKEKDHIDQELKAEDQDMAQDERPPLLGFRSRPRRLGAQGKAGWDLKSGLPPR